MPEAGTLAVAIPFPALGHPLGTGRYREASQTFQKHLKEGLGWSSEIPTYAQRLDLIAE